LYCYFLSLARHYRDLHSFPTRRSSDLGTDLGRNRRPRSAPAAALRGDRRRTAARPRRPCTAAADGDTRSGHLPQVARRGEDLQPDRKSTRLNSSHVSSSYAVFCLKKKI